MKKVMPTSGSRSADLTALCTRVREGTPAREAVEALSDTVLRAIVREMLLTSTERSARMRQVSMRLMEWRLLGIL